MIAAPPALKSRFDVSRESWERLEAFVAVLLEWQPRINLIAPSTVSDVWERHVADSLQLLPLIPPATLSIADLGSGGGFPGLVLAATTDAELHLIESNGKKTAFMRTVLRKIGSQAKVHQMRLEEVDWTGLNVDLVTARALAPLADLLQLAFPLLKLGATGLFHKGQNVDVELTAALKYWRLSYIRHPSLIDSQSSILEIKEISRVA